MARYDRGERRSQERRVQRKRFKDNRKWAAVNDPQQYGRLRHGHYGCGCSMCKPWKHGFEPKYKESELRRLQD